MRPSSHSVNQSLQKAPQTMAIESSNPIPPLHSHSLSPPTLTLSPPPLSHFLPPTLSHTLYHIYGWNSHPTFTILKPYDL